MRMLKDVFPEAAFEVFSWDPDYDAPRFNEPGIPCKFIRHKFNTNEFSLRNRLWLFLNGTLKIRTDKGLYAPQYFYDAIHGADLVVVSGGDILADYGEASVKHYFFPIAVASAMGKPVFVFAQSISRYQDAALRDFCKPLLDKVSLITVRERLSYDYLRELGVKAPLYLTADPAFTLQPCAPARLAEIAASEGVATDRRPLIGFSVSQTVTRWGEGSHERFVRDIAQAIDRLAELYPQAGFIFVPHVTYRNNKSNDDREVGREIFQQVTAKERVHLIEGDYTCQEAKGLIGLCDVFVGARTHATIAAASQLVPTLALAYSTKAYGIMADVLDRERSVLDVKELTADKVVAMVETLLNHKEQIVAEMRERMVGIRAASLKNAELARELVK